MSKRDAQDEIEYTRRTEFNNFWISSSVVTLAALECLIALYLNRILLSVSILKETFLHLKLKFLFTKLTKLMYNLLKKTFKHNYLKPSPKICSKSLFFKYAALL